MLKFLCARCQQKLSADETFVGKMVECPNCGAYMQVPEKKYCINNQTPETKNNKKKLKPVVPQKQFNKKLFFKIAVILLIFCGVAGSVFLYNQAKIRKRKELELAEKKRLEELEIARKEEIKNKIIALKTLSTDIKNKENLQTLTLIEKIKNNPAYKNKDLSKQINQYIYIIVLNLNRIDEVESLMQGIPPNDYESLKKRLLKKCKMCNGGNVKCHACRDTKKCPSCNGEGYYYIQNVSGYRKYVKCRSTCKACAKPKKCPFCKGTAALVNKPQLKTCLKQSKINLLKKTEETILETQRQLDNGKEKSEK